MRRKVFTARHCLFTSNIIYFIIYMYILYYNIKYYIQYTQYVIDNKPLIFHYIIITKLEIQTNGTVNGI